MYLDRTELLYVKGDFNGLPIFWYVLINIS